MSVSVKTVEARGVRGIAVAAPVRRRETMDFEMADIITKAKLIIK
jgi:hypothetical protein